MPKIRSKQNKKPQTTGVLCPYAVGPPPPGIITDHLSCLGIMHAVHVIKYHGKLQASNPTHSPLNQRVPSSFHQAFYQGELSSAYTPAEYNVRRVLYDLHALELVIPLDHPLVEHILFCVSVHLVIFQTRKNRTRKKGQQASPPGHEFWTNIHKSNPECAGQRQTEGVGADQVSKFKMKVIPHSHQHVQTKNRSHRTINIIRNSLASHHGPESSRSAFHRAALEVTAYFVHNTWH